MDMYHFTIVIRDARYQLSDLENRLFEAGCDDALLCSYNDTVYLEFDREAESAEIAIKSALQDIRAAGFKELIVEENGYASLSEMADRAGMSRQAFSLYAKNQRGDGNFPPPVYGLSSKIALYSWPEVATWLYHQGKLAKTHYDISQVVA